MLVDKVYSPADAILYIPPGSCISMPWVMSRVTLVFATGSYDPKKRKEGDAVVKLCQFHTQNRIRMSCNIVCLTKV